MPRKIERDHAIAVGRTEDALFAEVAAHGLMRIEIEDLRVLNVGNSAKRIKGIALTLTGRDGIDPMRVEGFAIDLDAFDAFTLRGEGAEGQLDARKARHPATEATLGIG